MAEEAELIPRAVRTPRAAAIAGIVFAVLYGTVLILIGQAVTVSPTDAGAWLTNSSQRDSVALALNVVPFAGIFFLWSLGALRDHLGVKEDKFFATLFLGSGLLFVGMMFVMAAHVGALLVLAAENQGRPLLDVWTFGRATAYNLMSIYATRMAGVFVLTTSTLALHTGLFPRWLALTGFANGLYSWRPSWLMLLELVFPIWVLPSHPWARRKKAPQAA
jgi:hypothetical protein